ncbi:MAG: hypothetical protein ACFE9L_08285 [Candidatus Hodarchaeota archaeon]
MHHLKYMIIGLIILSFFFINLFVIPCDAKLPSFLQEATYAQYEQKFSTGEIYELFWNITSINDSVVKITIRSHGIQFNSTTGEINVVPGGGIMFISKDTWKITNVLTDSGTIPGSSYTNKKVPFWIPTNIDNTTPIDTLYDNHVIPSHSDSLNLSYYSTLRQCWVTHNKYSEENYMDRWYDKETGIVLKISTQMKLSSSHISCLETLNVTNIETLIDTQNSTNISGFLFG